MGLGLIIIGLIFIINPSIGVFDILPDMIGWVFVWFGLRKLRDIAPPLGESVNSVIRLIIVGAARILVMIILPGMNDKAFSLVFTFVFVIFETVYMISAMRRIYDGMQYIGMRYGGEAVTADVSNARSITIVFALAKGLFTLLPELTHLFTTNYEGYITAFEQNSSTSYSLTLLILNVTVVTIFGLIWYGYNYKYFNKIRLDTALCNRLEEYYTEKVASDIGLMLYRRFYVVMLLLGAGSLFIFDIFLDGIDILPDFIGGFAFVAALGLLIKIKSEHKISPLPGIAYTATSIAGWILLTVLSLKYYYYGVTKTITSYYLYIALIILTAICSTLFVYMNLNIKRYFTGIVKRHTGEEHIPELKKMAERIELMKNDLLRAVNRFIIISVILSISKVLQTIFMYLPTVPYINISTIQIPLPPYGAVHFVIMLIWLVTAIWLYTDMYKRIKDKYLNDEK